MRRESGVEDEGKGRSRVLQRRPVQLISCIFVWAVSNLVRLQEISSFLTGLQFKASKVMYWEDEDEYEQVQTHYIQLEERRHLSEYQLPFVLLGSLSEQTVAMPLIF